MAVDYTTTGLINSVKIRTMAPSSQTTFTPDRYLQLMSEVMYSQIAPWVLSQRSEFLVEFVDIPIVMDQDTYFIPNRAFGQKIQQIFYGNQNGSITQFDPLVQVDEFDVIDKSFRTGRRFAYYIKGERIVLFPVPRDTTQNLRIFYYRRPSFLDQVVNCAKITVIAANVVTVDLIPTGWTTATVLDIVQNAPHFRAWQENATPTNVNTGTNQITFTSVDSNVKVGDYICQTGMSCVPQMPYEVWPLLSQATAVEVLKILGNPNAESAEAELQKIMQNTFYTVSPRADKQSKKLSGIFF